MNFRKKHRPVTTVVVVNGEPRAGKDTFINNAATFLRAARVPVDSYSSIDPVRDLLHGAGFDLRAKTEADRKLLAVIGDAVQEHSEWRTGKCLEHVEWFHLSNHRSPGVFFLHIREPHNIELVRDKLSGDIRMVTVFIESVRSEKVTSNAADAGVRDMDYMHTIRNDGTLADLSNAAAQFVRVTLLQ